MLARLNFFALRRRAQLGVRLLCPNGTGAVAFAAPQCWLGCEAPQIWGAVGKSDAADTPKSEQDALAPRAGRKSICWHPWERIGPRTVGFMVRLKVLDHNKQDS